MLSRCPSLLPCIISQSLDKRGLPGFPKGEGEDYRDYNAASKKLTKTMSFGLVGTEQRPPWEREALFLTTHPLERPPCHGNWAKGSPRRGDGTPGLHICPKKKHGLQADWERSPTLPSLSLGRLEVPKEVTWSSQAAAAGQPCPELHCKLALCIWPLSGGIFHIAVFLELWPYLKPSSIAAPTVSA